MTEPRPPRIRSKTTAEKEREVRRAAARLFVRVARQEISNREAGEEISPYDLIPETLRDLIADQLFAALMSPDFVGGLHRRGYALAPVYPGEEIPDAPADWLEEALELYGAEGYLADPLGVVDGLWRQAWQYGAAGQAARDATRLSPIPCARCGKAVSRPLPDVVIRAYVECPECVEREPNREHLDAAMHSAWRHGDWRWLTRNMSTDEREAAAAAVERHWATYDDDERVSAETLTELRWWRS